MTKKKILSIRKALGLNQTEFGQLLNAHFVTVSRWESGALEPNAYQNALLTQFEEAIRRERKEKFGNLVKNTLIGAGVAAAIYLLLKAANNGGK